MFGYFNATNVRFVLHEEVVKASEDVIQSSFPHNFCTPSNKDSGLGIGAKRSESVRFLILRSDDPFSDGSVEDSNSKSDDDEYFDW